VALLVAVAALLGASPASGADGLQATGANSCPPGTTAIQAVSKKVRPDGGTDTYYDIDHDGTLTDVPTPPPGFDPLSASDVDLESYGLPPRPANADAAAAWSAEMKGWRRNPDPGLCDTDYRAAQSLNWAGYYAAGSAGTYRAVQGDFRQPSSLSTTCANSTLASWTGLGGYNSEKLIQAGTAYLLGSSTAVAWYEYLGPNGQGINLTVMSGVTISAGDRIHTYEVIQTSTGQTTFYVANLTNGTSKSVIKTLSVSTYYDGSTAEFIDERLTYSGVLTPLRRFSDVNWTNAKVFLADGTWHSLGSQSEHAINMVNASLHTLAFPFALSSTTTFTERWNDCA
jgi:hypothetical protein